MTRKTVTSIQKPLKSLVVNGGQRLAGQIVVEGNKNAALPLLAACLLTDQVCWLTNMPRIKDVEVMGDLLRGLGATVSGLGTTKLQLCCAQLGSYEPDRTLVGRLRGSVLLCGPLLARLGQVRLAPPGGDFPARRTLAVHLQALKAMGVRSVEDGSGDYVLEAPEGLRPASVYLEEASVTGTETALLAAVAASGESEIRHAACEPHVVELCRFLTSMGAEVEGAGTPTIRVAGGCRLGGAEHQLDGDYIEAGSWVVAVAVTGGELDVRGVGAEPLEPITSVLRRMGLDCKIEGAKLSLRPSSPVAIRQVTTAPWPGFPSDMVSLISVLATQAQGRTLIHDWMYELRLFALEQLSGMAGNLFICDPHRMIVDGPAQLIGRTLDSRDLRSGMALIAAALAAKGTSRIHPLETVERGYAQLVERLIGLGADVEIEEG
ncbi:MAG: UDP-N-acetylglucosamine 1-carboxyvinyltransferase [Acidobacteria bacterium]|nr:UDP-N-acetylglucosamine 1-carboxyvinyltransferase [Acidobacteriota bacterium]|tara:strand:+ start:15503 stop:16804 length:1302 start_codon:yes stop_codon:yes gene_type:complete